MHYPIAIPIYGNWTVYSPTSGIVSVLPENSTQFQRKHLSENFGRLGPIPVSAAASDQVHDINLSYTMADEETK
ncbi:hypothetical protein LIER_17673 [Lithospermum erythrorhizon]|uniref:Uncharacterized protein n=1 Tax=Lithospermum erythrorhizon TaxID=34254 RepID=A0AAV3QB51_LITER